MKKKDQESNPLERYQSDDSVSDDRFSPEDKNRIYRMKMMSDIQQQDDLFDAIEEQQEEIEVFKKKVIEKKVLYENMLMEKREKIREEREELRKLEEEFNRLVCQA